MLLDITSVSFSRFLSAIAISSSILLFPEHAFGQTELAPNLGVEPEAFNWEDTPANYMKIDDLAEPGLNVLAYFPTANTVGKDFYGLRSYLASHDIALQWSVGIGYNQDLNRIGHGGIQNYNGQRFTARYDSNTNLIFSLNKYGLANAKFVAGVAYGHYDARDINGPDGWNVRAFYYHQSLFGGAMEVEGGWMVNYSRYIGLFMGGVPFLANGLSGAIPIQVGLSADPISAPSANVKFNADNGLYSKIGVQRSLNPRGMNYENERHGFGIRFREEGSGALYIGEAGVNRESSPGQKRLWFRAGAIHNNSDYIDFADGSKKDNKAAYAAIDMQLSQIEQSVPFRGVYVGASAFAAPDSVNVFTRTYEARLYLLGLVDSRPVDNFSLRLQYNKFSEKARDSYKQAGVNTYSSQSVFSVGYSMLASSGVYITPTITYQKNPSFVGSVDEGLIASLNIYLGI